MTHRDVIDRLSPFLDDELDPVASRELSQHLATCPDCAAEYDRQRKLSESLKRHAGITDAVSFVGLGQKFQIWEPGRFQIELAEATQKVRALKGRRSSQVAARNAPGARE